VSWAPVAKINVRVSRSSFVHDLRRTLAQLSKSVLFGSPSTARSRPWKEWAAQVWNSRVKSSRCCLLLARKSCLQMARSKERIGASIIWSQGIFGATSSYCCPPCPRVCWSFIWKESCPFAPQRSYVAALLCTRASVLLGSYGKNCLGLVLLRCAAWYAENHV
jgi:hypothetical protein